MGVWKGDLDSTDIPPAKISDITVIDGTLYLYSNIDLSSLYFIKNHLIIYQGRRNRERMNLKSLKYVDGYINIYSGVKVELPELTKVNGKIWIHPDAEVKMHKRLRMLMIAKGI